MPISAIRRSTLGAVLFFCTSGPAAAQTFASLGPFGRDIDVSGVPVTVATTIELEAGANQAAGTVAVRVLLDLGDLQAKVGNILATLPLPRDNCASYKPDNLVASISQGSLGLSGASAVFSLHANLEVWTCLENPVPNSKVEMQVKDLGLGVKTKVPVVVTWPGDPIKTKILSQSFNASIPFDLRTLPGQSVAIVPGQPKIDLTGQYASITDGILSVANVDINDIAAEAITKAIDPDDLRGCLPDEIESLNPVVRDARFFDQGGGRLAAAVEMEATLSLVGLAALIPKLSAIAKADLSCD